MAKGTVAAGTVKLGDNADTSKNFLIKVPAVADGTLKIQRENGTDVLSIDANGKVTVPGNAQTLQNVVASRALATDYTNGTAFPIAVVVSASSTLAFTLRAIVNGLTLVLGTQGTSGYVVGGTFIVPPGGTYRVTVDAGTSTISTWVELR